MNSVRAGDGQESSDGETPGNTGNIFVSEVFSAIQGEGSYVGERQVFLRLSGCNIRCSYCDQPEALELKGGDCRVEATPGRRDFSYEPSPAAIEEVAVWVDQLWNGVPHHSVTVTGGEPLMQSRKLAALLPVLKSRGHRIHLETNGVLSIALGRVVQWIDAISMDIKLNSVDGEGIDLATHGQFLKVAAAPADRPHLYVKIVLGPDTAEAELDQAVALIADRDEIIEVVLQPVSPFGTVGAAPTPEQVLRLHDLALRIHPRVKVIPQTHKAIGQL